MRSEWLNGGRARLVPCRGSRSSCDKCPSSISRRCRIVSFSSPFLCSFDGATLNKHDALCSATRRTPYPVSLLLNISDHFVSPGKISCGRARHTFKRKAPTLDNTTTGRLEQSESYPNHNWVRLRSSHCSIHDVDPLARTEPEISHLISRILVRRRGVRWFYQFFHISVCMCVYLLNWI